MCDIVISKIRAWPVKKDEQQHGEHEDIEKKVGIFHILNGILPKLEKEKKNKPKQKEKQSDAAKRLPSKTT